MKKPHARLGFSLAGILVPLALVLSSAGGSPAPGASSEEIRDVLSRRLDDRRSRAEVLEELTRLGSKGIPDLFDLYTGSSFEKLLGEGTFREEDWWCRPDQFTSLALAALAKLPPKQVVSHLAARTSQAELETRICAVRVLGALRSAQGLELLIAQADALRGPPLRSMSVRKPLQESLLQIATHDRDAVERIAEIAAVLDEELLLLVAEGVCSAERTEAVPFLLGILGRDPTCDLTILEGVARAVSQRPWKLRVDPGPPLRKYLMHEDPALRRAAAAALGRLGDTESFEDLVRLLEQPGLTRVRSTAGWSLQQLSGEDFGDDSDAWWDWHNDEHDWWIGEGEDLLDEFRDADPERMAAIVGTLARHPLHRNEIASDLVGMLSDVPDELRPTLIRGLQALGSRQAVPVLVDLLFERDVLTRQAAGTALQALTGRDLPPEPRIWSEYVNG